jgi:polysaccharide deacetylase family protein (PEP-CTERM system associated)
MNFLTIDLEDWQPLADKWVGGVPSRPNGPVDLQVDRIRRLLDKAGVRATFFCLGITAEKWPGVIRTLAAEGHEIASHGYSHAATYLLSPEQFAEDIRRAQDVLGNLTGYAPSGYRAPQFSITRRTWWALEILAAQGLRYDSSVFPIVHRRYGIAGFSRYPCRISTPAGTLIELPLATARRFGANIPVAGGGYFRYFPQSVVLGLLRGMDRDAVPCTTYFHPYEFDPGTLRLSVTPTSLRHRLRCLFFAAHQNLGRRSVSRKVAALLKSLSFSTCIQYVSSLSTHANELLEYHCT